MASPEIKRDIKDDQEHEPTQEPSQLATPGSSQDATDSNEDMEPPAWEGVFVDGSLLWSLPEHLFFRIQVRSRSPLLPLQRTLLTQSSTAKAR